MTDNEVWVGAYTFEQSPGVPDTGLTGSTGVFVQQHNATIDNLRLRGNTTIANEIGVRVATHRNGLNLYIDTSGGGGGFNDSGDRILKFDADSMTGTTTANGICYVVYEGGMSPETPVQIPANWGSGLRIFTRVNTASTWTELTTGHAYP
jgi:hypothetical protein